jgi:6-phosphogluconolactonase
LSPIPKHQAPSTKHQSPIPNTPPTFEVVENPASAAARLIADAAGSGAHLALAGGSTPRAAYEQAADMDVDWSSAHLWFGDERCVPPDHEHSNHLMVQRALLDRLDAGVPPTVHRMQGELGPHKGSDAYQAELRSVFGEGPPPRLDLVLLGLGPDMHTASLFPGHDELGESRRWVVGVEMAGMAPLVPRITLTPPVLNAAKRVVFLIAGEDKAEAVATAFSGRRDPSAPASLVQPDDGELVVVLDEGAAKHLNS